MSTQVGGRRPCVTPLCSAPACCQAVLAHLCPPACTRTRSHARRWSPPPPRPLRSLTRVGVMVLVCHESNDIFLEAAKVRGTQGRMGGGGGGGGSAGMLALTQQRCAGGRRVGTPPWRQQKVGSGRMGAQARWVTGDPMRAGQARMWSRSRRAQIKPARLQMHALLPPPSPPLRWHGTPSMRRPPPPSLWVSEEAVEEEGGREGGGCGVAAPLPLPALDASNTPLPWLHAPPHPPSLLFPDASPATLPLDAPPRAPPRPPAPPAPPPPPPPFPVFMLSWFTTRVFMFPMFVIRSTLFESLVGAAAAPQRRAALQQAPSRAAQLWFACAAPTIAWRPVYSASLGAAPC